MTCVVLAFFWESVDGRHWVCGDVLDVQFDCDLVGMKVGVERGNVVVGVMVRVVDEFRVVDVPNDVENVSMIESGIGEHVVDEGGEWNAVVIWIDLNVVEESVDVVEPEVEVEELWLVVNGCNED